MTTGGRRLSDLLRRAGVVPLSSTGGDPEVRGACLDSRLVAPGELFLALRGEHADGLEFVPQALERGAVAVVAASPRPRDLPREVAWVRVPDPRRVAGPLARECYGRPDEAMTLVGITGTNGKTTVAYLVEAIAVAAGRRAGRVGTVSHAVAGAERPAARTTPEAPDLFRLLSEMREEQVETVAIEVSSHALALHRVAGARFAVAAFLNLGRDHLDFHGTEDAYFEAKATLFDGLERQAWAVVPAESPHGARLRTRTRARVLGFGRSSDADVRLTQEHCGTEGSSAVLETPGGSLPLRTFLLGRFNLDNVAAAAACALAAGLPPEAITAGVLALPFVPGRMQPVDHGQPFRVFVDYAHTEQALRGLLAAVDELVEGRLHLVFGCGGDRDAGKRGEMGRAAAESGALLYLTSDNPRGEDPEKILHQIAEGVATVPGAADRCRRIVDRAQAIRRAIDSAEPGDAVILAGKGHETTQTAAGKSVAFDDREVAARALEELGFERRRSA